MPELGGILENLRRGFKRSKTGLSVYLTDRIFRVLELDSHRKPLFEPVEIVFNRETEEEKEKIISRIIDRHGLKGKEVVSCLTVDEGMLKLYKFPSSMPKNDLIEAIKWHIYTETQQIKDETVYDYYFLDRGSDDKHIRVIITIARKHSVDNLQNRLIKLGLKPKIIDYEVIAIINYGLMNNLPTPFAILNIDYCCGLLVYFSKTSLSYNRVEFDYLHYKETGHEDALEAFLVDVRNLLVLNEISNIYLAGPVIEDERTLEAIMTNLPVLGMLDLEDMRPSFIIPYALSVRGLEG